MQLTVLPYWYYSFVGIYIFWVFESVLSLQFFYKNIYMLVILW